MNGNIIAGLISLIVCELAFWVIECAIYGKLRISYAFYTAERTLVLAIFIFATLVESRISLICGLTILLAGLIFMRVYYLVLSYQKSQ